MEIESEVNSGRFLKNFTTARKKIDKLFIGQENYRSCTYFDSSNFCCRSNLKYKLISIKGLDIKG